MLPVRMCNYSALWLSADWRHLRLFSSPAISYMEKFFTNFPYLYLAGRRTVLFNRHLILASGQYVRVPVQLQRAMTFSWLRTSPFILLPGYFLHGEILHQFPISISGRTVPFNRHLILASGQYVRVPVQLQRAMTFSWLTTSPFILLPSNFLPGEILHQFFPFYTHYFCFLFNSNLIRWRRSPLVRRCNGTTAGQGYLEVD